LLKTLSLAVAMTLSATGAAAAELTLEFPEVGGGGQVSIAVFDNGEGWLRRTRPVWAETRAVGAGPIRVTRDLPPGAYAVMAYHDRNANGRLDTLPVGLPTEAYGFSNNSRGLFGPPAWRQAAFQLTGSGARQLIRLR
jgi:uncharacterized protein (DUF2141 family)